MSKITLLCAIAILFTQLSFGQEENNNYVNSLELLEGTFYLGASSNLNATYQSNSYEEYDDNKSWDFNISPSFGYFVLNDFLIGINLDLNYYKNIAENSGPDYKSSTTTINTFLRYYFNLGKLKPFIDVDAGYGASKTVRSSYRISGDMIVERSEFKNNFLDYGATGGIAIFFTKIVSLDLGLNYNRRLRYERDFDQESSEISAMHNSITLQGGISVFF